MTSIFSTALHISRTNWSLSTTLVNVTATARSSWLFHWRYLWKCIRPARQLAVSHSMPRLNMDIRRLTSPGAASSLRRTSILRVPCRASSVTRAIFACIFTSCVGFAPEGTGKWLGLHRIPYIFEFVNYLS